MTATIQTPDGRSLALHEAGDPNGLPVIVHHGTPGSGLLYDRWATPGIRLIGYDRAGYGGSSRKRGRDIAAVVADVEAIADSLALDRYATWGISGGGPHALACAALCGDRLTERRHSRASLHGEPRASTGTPAWARTTSRSSISSSQAKRRSAPRWNAIATRCSA